ncbi:MAG: peptidoglycan DD-metalloendopeptidase family protein [Candidatus Dormibacteraceae bacterium]
MKRALGAIALALVALAVQVTAAGATSPSPCPSPSTASSARVVCSSTATDPNQAAYDQLRARLGGDLAGALTTQQKLVASLNRTSASVQIVTDQVTREETVISTLEDQIAQLDSQIADTQARIDVEKEQVAAMAKAIYRQPDSLWMLIARTGNVSQALQATSDLVIAGQRAHALQSRLEADLLKLQADRAARQADLDRENATLDQLNTSLSTLSDLLSTQSDLSSQVADVITQIQDADNSLQDQPPDVTAELATLLESQAQDLLLQSNQAAWDAAHVGAGEALIAHMLPTGTTVSGLILSWPVAGGRVTQPFGPSDLLLEPPLGKYAHFHTGIDIAAPFGTTVTAAAPGVVVAVGHSSVGYGNYVVIGHGGGIMTLYGHLLETDVQVGDVVKRGQRIGLEGSTGWSTGPHVHFELRVNDAVVDPMPYLLPAS